MGQDTEATLTNDQLGSLPLPSHHNPGSGPHSLQEKGDFYYLLGCALLASVSDLVQDLLAGADGISSLDQD